jgi:hypothetical protein
MIYEALFGPVIPNSELRLGLIAVIDLVGNYLHCIIDVLFV